MSFPYFTLIVCVLVIILIIVATLAIIYFQSRQDCYKYISPWCGLYSCNCSGTTGSSGITGSTGSTNTCYNPTAAFQQVIANCQPVNGQPNPLCQCSWFDFYSPTGGQTNTCTT